MLTLSIDLSISYSIAFFLIALISTSVLNLFKQHYIFQITGIAFLFVSVLVKTLFIIRADSNVLFSKIYLDMLPILSSIGACIVSMALGFWVFPPIRRKFKN